MRALMTAIKLTVTLTILCGLIYPLAMTGLANILFPHQAQGSLIERDGKVVGSELIGQTFAAPGYFMAVPRQRVTKATMPPTPAVPTLGRPTRPSSRVWSNA